MPSATQGLATEWCSNNAGRSGRSAALVHSGIGLLPERRNCPLRISSWAPRLWQHVTRAVKVVVPYGWLAPVP